MQDDLPGPAAERDSMFHALKRPSESPVRSRIVVDRMTVRGSRAPGGKGEAAAVIKQVSRRMALLSRGMYVVSASG